MGVEVELAGETTNYGRSKQERGVHTFMRPAICQHLVG